MYSYSGQKFIIDNYYLSAIYL